MASFMLYKTLFLLSKQKTQTNQHKKYNNSSDTNFSAVCTICCQEEGSIPIFNNTHRPQMAREIFWCSGVKIKPSAKQSKVICQNCLDLLDGCIKFRHLCRTAHKRLKSIKQSSVIKNDQRQENLSDGAYSNNILVTRHRLIKEEIQQDIEVDDGPEFENMPSECEESSNQWICEDWNRMYSGRQEYLNHLPCKKILKKKEKNENKFSTLCDVCGKVFKSVYNLIRHRELHFDVFPYKCASCPYEGKTRCNFIIHMRSHLPNSERPYKCAHCPKTAVTASNLAHHVKRVHSTERPFKCPLCKKSFSVKAALASHTKVMHLRKEPVECSICYNIFSSNISLRYHKMKVHNIKPVKSNLPNRLPAYIRAKMAAEDEVSHFGKLHNNRDDVRPCPERANSPRIVSREFIRALSRY